MASSGLLVLTPVEVTRGGSCHLAHVRLTSSPNSPERGFSFQMYEFGK